MKIGFITTLNTNIGDDLIREGIINLLKSLLDSEKLKFIFVNKHKPNELYSKLNPVNLFTFIKKIKGGHFVYRLIEKLFAIPLFSKFYSCDLIIQSGAPVLWANCHINEWAKPIWYDNIGKLYKKKHIFNLAAGSSYPSESYPQKLDNQNDINYLKDIGKFCSLTTVRDDLAENILDSIGIKSVSLPCTALFSSKKKIVKEKAKCIYISYMEGGGHFDWNQGIDKLKWQNTIEIVVKKLSQSYTIKFLCHNEREKVLAEEQFMDYEIVFPKTTKEYFEVINDARIGIFNRMHASVAFASYGVPSIAIGTDSRLEMVRKIGLPAYYVKDIDATSILDEMNEMNENWTDYNRKLIALKEKSQKEYIALLHKYVFEREKK